MSVVEEPRVGDGRLLDPLVKRWTAVGAAISVAVFWLVGTLGRPWLLFADQGIVASRFYDIQAQRLLHGHLSVPSGSLQIEEFVTPQGSHMYFGIFPALIRVPLFVVGDVLEGRLTLVSCLAAVLVASVCTARLARRAERRFWPSSGEAAPSPRWYLLIAAAPVAMTPVVHLAARSMVYHEALAWGLAGAVWGIDAAMQWWYLGRRRDLVIAVAAAVVAVNARPSIGMIPVLMLVALGAVAATRREPVRAGTAALIAVIAFGSYAIVNVARFRQLWGAPGGLQAAIDVIPEMPAAVEMTGGSLFSARFIPTNLLAYLDPSGGSVQLSRLFPFVEFGEPPDVVGSVPMVGWPTGSLPTSAPVLMVLAAIGLVWVVRRGDAAWRCAVGASALATVSTLAFWATFHRYLVDFVPLLLVLAAPGWWWALATVRGWHQRRRRVTAVVLGGVAVAALSVQAALAVWSGTLFYSPDHDDQASMLRLRYAIDDAFLTGMPPEMFVVGTDGTKNPFIAPRAGRVLIAGDCDVMYTGDAGWRRFEMPSGGAFRVVVVPTDEELAAARTQIRSVASGDGWELAIDPNGAGGAMLRLLVEGLAVTEGPIDLDRGVVVLDVVADALVQGVTVSQDSRIVLARHVPGLRGLRAATGWEVLPSEAPTCEVLLERHRLDAARVLARGR